MASTEARPTRLSFLVPKLLLRNLSFMQSSALQHYKQNESLFIIQTLLKQGWGRSCVLKLELANEG